MWIRDIMIVEVFLSKMEISIARSTLRSTHTHARTHTPRVTKSQLVPRVHDMVYHHFLSSLRPFNSLATNPTSSSRLCAICSQLSARVVLHFAKLVNIVLLLKSLQSTLTTPKFPTLRCVLCQSPSLKQYLYR